MPYTEEMIRRLVVQRRIFLAINCIAAVAMLLLFLQISHIQNRQDDQSKDVQLERVRAVLVQCHQQNRRHDEALTRLHKLLAQSGVSLARRRTSFRTTKFLIDALQPKQNCWAKAKKLVPSGTR